MIEHKTQKLTIGGVAKVVGVNVETIRFYQREGLLPTPPKPMGGIRRYSKSDVARLNFIRSAQQLGFSLTEVRELLFLEDGAHCDQARALAELKLRDIRQKLASLERMARALGEVISACGRQTDGRHCPLISSLQRQESP